MKRMVAVLLATAVLLSSCGLELKNYGGEVLDSGIAAARPAHTALSLTWEVPFEEDSALGMELSALLKEYERTGRIRVRLQYDGNEEHRLLSELLSDDPPDLMLIPAELLRNFASQGYLREWEAPEGLLESGLRWCRVGGVGYGSPYLGETMAVLANQKRLEQADGGAGTEPLTWEEFESLCARLEAETDGRALAGVALQTADLSTLMEQWFSSAGGELVRVPKNGEEPGADSPELRRALAFYQRLLEHYSTQDYEDNNLRRAFQVFQLRQSALAFGLPSHLREQQRTPGGFEAVALRFPAGSAGSRTTLNLLAFAIPVGAPEKLTGEAEAMVRWLSQPEQYDRLMAAQWDRAEQGTFWLPCWSNPDELGWYQEHPEYRVFAEAIAESASPPASGKWSQVQKGLLPLIHAVVTGQMELDEGIRQMEKKKLDILNN